MFCESTYGKGIDRAEVLPISDNASNASNASNATTISTTNMHTFLLVECKLPNEGLLWKIASLSPQLNRKTFPAKLNSPSPS